LVAALVATVVGEERQFGVASLNLYDFAAKKDPEATAEEREQMFRAREQLGLSWSLPQLPGRYWSSIVSSGRPRTDIAGSDYH